MLKYILMAGFGLLLCAGNSPAQVTVTIVGFTQYDMQCNGSTGNRIAVADDGTIYCVWMNGISYPYSRSVYYNVRNPAGSWLYWNQGFGISYRNGGGYPQIALNNNQMPAVAYHHAATSAESIMVAIDTSWGNGNFQYFHPPNRFSGDPTLWPYISIGLNGIFHAVSTTVGDFRQNRFIAYSNSTDNGQSWSNIRIVDTVLTISAIITSSRVSNKTAIVYCAPMDTSIIEQSDIYYVESTDGIQWDFENGIVNVTGYLTDNDSIAAYNDCDAIYDYNDNLHIIWDARPVLTNGSGYDDRLLHFRRSDGAISEMNRFSDHWPEQGCEFGANNWSFAKMSLGVKTNNDLFAIYTSWDSSDCSAAGYANGDIYMTWSADSGESWEPQENITNWRSPGCGPGSCDNDHWSSLAERVDDYLHVIFIDDKDAGAVPQTEGSVTDCPVMYLEYPVPLSSERRGINIPGEIELSQNYPNPFNAKTNICFSLKKQDNVRLEIFSILGDKVATIINEPREAGSYTVTWDADKQASGIYYYRLSTSEGAISKQMVLIK